MTLMPSHIEITESDTPGSPVIMTLDGPKRIISADGQNDSSQARLHLGSNGKAEILIQAGPNSSFIRIGARKLAEGLSEGTSRGVLNISDQNGRRGCHLGGEGTLILENEKEIDVFQVNANDAAMRIGPFSANGSNKGGELKLTNAKGIDVAHIVTDEPRMRIGPVSASDKGGSFRVRNKEAKQTINLEGDGGIIVAKNEKEIDVFQVNADIAAMRIGPVSASDKGGSFRVRNKEAQETIRLEGDTGNITCVDVIFQNADCAEEFDISSYELTEVEPGSVMVIDNDGGLQVSSKPYDKRVAGVISGGGNLKPAIILDKKKSQNLRAPLAMLGKAYCKIDAEYSQVKVGDMLTTSSTPGHAMKATNHSKAFGAVIGKALQSLKKGKGLIPILIALQ
jgi:hypothetical protein